MDGFFFVGDEFGVPLARCLFFFGDREVTLAAS